MPALTDRDKMIVQSGISPRSSLTVETRLENSAPIDAKRLETERISENNQAYGCSSQSNFIVLLLQREFGLH
jgi:hypothetical protein